MDTIGTFCARELPVDAGFKKGGSLTIARNGGQATRLREAAGSGIALSNALLKSVPLVADCAGADVRAPDPVLLTKEETDAIVRVAGAVQRTCAV